MDPQNGSKVSRNNYNLQNEDQDMDLRRGPWTVDEDFTLINYIAHHGEGRWNSLARCAGLKRTGKSCRLRWLNYLRPDVRRGNITLEEQLLILELHSRWGNRWSKIAQHLPGRTDNEIKNYWRTRVQKHAKQLKCDVNSKQFKDTMRYLWMPRLVDRIQAASAAAPSCSTNSAATSTCNVQSNTNLELGASAAQLARLQHRPSVGGGVRTNYTPENSSGAASSESLGTPASDLTESFNDYPTANNQQANAQDYYPTANNHLLSNYGDQTLISPSGGYFNQAIDLMEQNSQWMESGDLSDSLWNVDDLFLQQ